MYDKIRLDGRPTEVVGVGVGVATLATVGNMSNDSLLNGSLDDMTHVSMVIETAMAWIG